MKRLIISIAVIFGFLTVPVLADMRISVDINAGVGHASGGGEFGITVLDALNGGGDPIGIYGVGDTFHTFCLEKTEQIYNGSFYVTLSGSAIAGGIGGGSPDPLSDQSAWIYSQWLDGVLWPHNATYANAVQEAVWRLENESTGTGGLAGDLVDDAMEAVNGGWQNTDIMVMNLWYYRDHTGFRQDVMVRVPTPAAVILGVLGLGVAGWKLRRFA